MLTFLSADPKLRYLNDELPVNGYVTRVSGACPEWENLVPDAGSRHRRHRLALITG